MIDRYTKAILTLIAVSLVALAVSQIAPAAKALSSCGEDLLRPCYVRIIN